MHYFRNTSTLKDGDLVLMDFAPDYRYYVSDIGRVWPVNGKYTAQQRELLQFVLEFHKAVLSRIRPGVTSAQIHDEAKKAMEPVFARTKFSKPIYETGRAHAGRERRRRVLAHGRHGGARRRQLPRRSAEAGSGLLDRSAAAGARGESLSALRGHGGRHRDRASRTSPTSSRWSSTTWKSWCARRASCSTRRRSPRRRSSAGRGRVRRPLRSRLQVRRLPPPRCALRRTSRLAAGALAVRLALLHPFDHLDEPAAPNGAATSSRERSERRTGSSPERAPVRRSREAAEVEARRRTNPQPRSGEPVDRRGPPVARYFRPLAIARRPRSVRAPYLQADGETRCPWRPYMTFCGMRISFAASLA